MCKTEDKRNSYTNNMRSQKIAAIIMTTSSINLSKQSEIRKEIVAVNKP